MSSVGSDAGHLSPTIGTPASGISVSAVDTASRTYAIAGIQMNVSAVASNVPMMKVKLEICMQLYPWVQMVVFSELCAYGPLLHTAQALPCDFEAEMQALARQYGIWLLPGSIFERGADNKVYNTTSVIDPTGRVVTRYRKMFPFYPYEVGVTPGQDFCVFDVPGVARFGLLICYDMWFPETVRTLAVRGAEVILHPTMTGTIDRDIELSIVRSMAAVNQCYFFDINGLDTGGSGLSIVCGPDGRVLYEAKGNEEIIPIEIDLARVERSRRYGVLRLGQPLKSFRDSIKTFSVYAPSTEQPYLDSLGPLIKPTRLARLTELKMEEPMASPFKMRQDPLPVGNGMGAQATPWTQGKGAGPQPVFAPGGAGAPSTAQPAVSVAVPIPGAPNGNGVHPFPAQ